MIALTPSPPCADCGAHRGGRYRTVGAVEVCWPCWASRNPHLADGEAGEPDTGPREKVGSGPDPRGTTTTYLRADHRYTGRVYSPDVITKLVQRPEEPVPYRVDGVTADGTVTILSAGAGMGKSVFAQALCDGVTDGRSVAGFGCAVGTALYVDGEMGQVMFTNRLRKMGVKAGRYWYVDALGLDISIDKPDDLGWIRQHIERVGANLVVIDSLRRLMPSKSENDSDDMAPAVGAVAKLARDTNAAILLIHHKGDGEKFYRGSTAIKDQADALFGLLPVNPDDDDDMRRRLTCRGARGKAPRYDDAPLDRYVLVDFSAGGVVAVDAPRAEGTVIPLRQAVATAIKAAMPVKSKREAAGKIGRHDKDQMFRDAWEDLERAGGIAQVNGGWVATDTSPPFEPGEGGAIA